MPRREHYEHGAPCWVECLSGAREDTAAFYHHLFGWQLDRAAGAEDGYWMLRPASTPAHPHPPGVIGGLSRAPAGIPATWTTYLSVPDVPAAVRHALTLGATTVLPPFTAGSDGVLAMILDPCQQVVGLWQGAHDEGIVMGDEPGSLCWHELRTSDPDRCADFYADVVGLRRRGQQLFAGDQAVATLVQASGAKGWQVCFAVEDVPSGAARALGGGARFVAGSLCGPLGRPSVELTDPQGARFMLTAAT